MGSSIPEVPSLEASFHLEGFVKRRDIVDGLWIQVGRVNHAEIGAQVHPFERHADAPGQVVGCRDAGRVDRLELSKKQTVRYVQLTKATGFRLGPFQYGY